ncbi:PAS domain-containing sensor histidine kinase [Desulfuromonas sp. TF]|uniref:sensor histidine kinase n=1 Tax=Desulfuromonas sp. TF TaxID=1232410 RepID=UPI0004240B08|nr:PAS domain-containing sensor histidine kinase [Desulfuromonas sp. TF]
MSNNRREQIDILLGESDLLHDIFESTHDGILVIGEDGIIAYSNLAAEKLLGISHDAMNGVKAEQLPLRMHYRSCKEIPQESKPFAAAFSNGTIKGPTQVILKRPDGSTLPVLFNVRRKDKGITVAVLTDHSEMMRRQQQADDYYNLLAHDIRTPLTVILGHAEILKINMGKTEDRSVKAIIDAVKQLEAFTKEMSDRMLLESGNFKLEKENIQLIDVIKDVVSQIEPTMKKHKIHLDGPSILTTVKADNYRLKRVFFNILTNAIKYSPEGTTIFITLWENTKGIMIKFTNQGHGIEPEDLNYIFDPFYITTVGKNKGGTGLGLYISRLIMEAHDGRIYVSSDKEETSFTIHLPKGS